jgi:hypothetical protein
MEGEFKVEFDFGCSYRRSVAGALSGLPLTPLSRLPQTALVVDTLLELGVLPSQSLDLQTRFVALSLPKRGDRVGFVLRRSAAPHPGRLEAAQRLTPVYRGRLVNERMVKERCLLTDTGHHSRTAPP